ncbi:MAG: DMT family transporter [Rhodobacteraceae bacterium]|nr:DMT family transporter [Paracoccaceae bacterium]
MVGLTSVLFGLIPLFARGLTEAGLAPAAVSMYRYLLPAIVFLPFLVLRGPAGRLSMLAMGTGLLVALGWVGYVRALTMMPVPVAGVLYMTYPLFVLAVGRILFGDRPHPGSWLGGLLILLGALLVAFPALAGGNAAFGPVAVLLALAAPLGFGLGINMLTHVYVALPPLARLAAFSLGSVAGLLPVAAGLPAAAVIPADWHALGLVIGLTFVTALLPQVLYNVYVPRIGAAKTGALGAIELPTMFAVGWVVLGEAPGWREIVAGLFVLTAVVLTPARAPRPSGLAALDVQGSGRSGRGRTR